MNDVDALLAQLRGNSQHTASGTFTLDRERAREKMRQFQLADPHRWIVLLVRAAVLRGATRVRVSVDASSVIVELDGPPLARSDFEELYASMFASSRAPEIQARRDLALAFNAAMALAPEVLRVESGVGSAAVAFEMRPNEEDVIEPCTRAIEGTRVRLVLGRGSETMESLRAPERQGPEQRLLRTACKWSEHVIELEGERISFGLDALEVRGKQEIGDGGRCGFSHDGSAASIIVLQHGLVLATRRPIGFPPGFVAVVDCSDLLTDVSHSEPVEDEAWESLLERVRGAATRSLAAVAREVTASGEHPHREGVTPRWLWTMMRDRLADHGPVELARTNELVDALVDLPLWRRANGSPCTTRALAKAEAPGYTSSYGADRIPLDFRDTIVVDEANARVLCRVLPFAVDRSSEMSEAIEREARRARPKAVEVPKRSEPAPPAAKERPAPEQPRKPAKDLHLAKFLRKPQLYTVKQPTLAVGPVTLAHEGVRCTIGVTASSIAAGGHELARVRVIVQRRVLTELKLLCPVPGVDAVVAADDLRANPTWNGLADDASRLRVLAALAKGTHAIVDALAQHGDDPSPTARVVLGATLRALLFDPLLLRAWLAVRDTELFARLVAWIESRGLAETRAALEPAIAERDPVRSIAALLPDASSSTSLRVALVGKLATLFELPLFGKPARSLAQLAAAPRPDAGLRGRELDVVRRVLGLGGCDVDPLVDPSRPQIEIVEPPTEAAQLAMPTPRAGAERPARAEAEAEAEAEVETEAETDAQTDDEHVAVPQSVEEPLPPPVPIRAYTRNEALVEAVIAELRAIARLDDRLPADARLEAIAFGDVAGNSLAQVIGGRVMLSRTHPVVATALASETPDPWLVAFVASAVYTAVNTWLEEITDEHEAWFIAAHARHATRLATTP